MSLVIKGGETTHELLAPEAANGCRIISDTAGHEAARRVHPLSHMSLKGLEQKLQEAIAEAEAAGMKLDSSHPVRQVYARRMHNLANAKCDMLNQLHALVSSKRLLVIDLEATFYDKQAPDADMDVIEIGGVLVDGASMSEIDELQMYVKPTHTEVGLKCSELTGIGQHLVANAPSFVQRMIEIGEFIRASEVNLWASFGLYDKKKIARQCQRDGVQNPLENVPHINIKSLVGAHYGYSKKHSPGLGAALIMANIPRQGRAHNGLDDARNIVAVMRHVLREHDLIDGGPVDVPEVNRGKRLNLRF